MKKNLQLFFILLCLFSGIFVAKATDFGNKSVFTLTIGGLNLKIETYGQKIVRVVKSPVVEKLSKQSLSVILPQGGSGINRKETPTEFVLTTQKLKIRVNKLTGTIGFFDLSNRLLLNESANVPVFLPAADINGESYKIKQQFKLSSTEAVYGLGQDQRGIINFRNHTVLLKQRNMYVANPFLLSSKGYGLLWDNYSVTTFADDAKGTSFESEIGDCIDYYFVYGGTSDGTIAAYRELTGSAPMYGKWVFGLWQCRERYQSQDEITGVVEKYRDLKVPLDNIVQDWRYWGIEENVWNSTEFGNPKFPDPKAMIDKIHKSNAHIMISVWPSFGDSTAIYKELNEKGLLLNFKTWPSTERLRVYDAFNPKARSIYWKYINKNLFSIGMDAWWLDATEPEQGDRQGKIDSTQTALGSFKRFGNAFPLETNKGVYENQRKTSSDKRVFILTRSAFSGQQRFGASTWSGDIEGTWQVFHNQIAGGINFCLSGIPYWTTDIGGFWARPELYPKGVADIAYQELYVRWFQFGAFSPLFRSHGTNTPREIFQFGKKGYWACDVQEKYINLRYRLLPYIYSQSWRVTSEGASMMRGLVMDFPTDTVALNVANQYMFGPSLLVTPVTEPLYTTRDGDFGKSDFSTIKSTAVYLPESQGWFDFWTGEKYTGGKQISRQTPIDILPLYVKAGSIIPMGPTMQYATEKKEDPIELRVYTGADANFILYEDENDNYNYEKGIYSLIPIHWDEKTKTLTIGKRKGEFPGMLQKRTFRIVFVSQNHGIADEVTAQADRVVYYSGTSVLVK
ncbi:TIM-barrel domain-containing protein [uncultured Bacteroides sp.]|uniref:glycoside hydrolase family 31 protein n=1 Tax=uncultured Bacteroides sp. TaxID=162156 RepID=UPI002AA83030|nr:TIM-barrel domain-containing protein [uncultured Bacteroides sp.]